MNYINESTISRKTQNNITRSEEHGNPYKQKSMNLDIFYFFEHIVEAHLFCQKYFHAAGEI